MYHTYHIQCDQTTGEILIALLSADGLFDSFEETASGLDAYVLAEATTEADGRIGELSQRFGLDYEKEALEERNWNAVWESQFAPIDIGSALTIRASFHPPAPAIAQKIIIDPRMAFGTGHHATTYMMCELLLDHPPAGQRVFDYGCGTGVLAILAKKLGANYVDAVDIERPSAENTRENAEKNHVHLDAVIRGTLDDVPPGPPYDLILANINRNVILDTAGALYRRLQSGGRVYFSGILEQDEQLLHDRLSEIGFHHLDTRKREGWRALVFTRD